MIFGSAKKTKKMDFWADFLGLPGWAVTPAVACLGGIREGKPSLVRRGMQAEGLARPGPEGGRIEPAEPEPPPALFICKVGEGM